VATATASGDGAANAVSYIIGGTATQLLWPESSIPTTFTVCSVTRFVGGTYASLLSCIASPTQSIGWYHGQGHGSGIRGIAYYGGYRCALGNVGVRDDWLVMCGTNGEAIIPGNIILDQDEIGTGTGGTGGCRLNINYGSPSDWALHSLLIWDYSLGTAPVPAHNRADRIHVAAFVDVILSIVSGCTVPLAGDVVIVEAGTGETRVL
jgi:hypothetical protein